MKKAYAVFIIGALLLTIAGCETIKGIGKDISTVGGWLTRGSEKAQNAPDSRK